MLSSQEHWRGTWRRIKNAPYRCDSFSSICSLASLITVSLYYKPICDGWSWRNESALLCRIISYIKPLSSCYRNVRCLLPLPKAKINIFFSLYQQLPCYVSDNCISCIKSSRCHSRLNARKSIRDRRISTIPSAVSISFPNTFAGGAHRTNT